MVAFIVTLSPADGATSEKVIFDDESVKSGYCSTHIVVNAPLSNILPSKVPLAETLIKYVPLMLVFV